MYLNNPDFVDFSATTNTTNAGLASTFVVTKISQYRGCLSEIKQCTGHLKYLQVQILHDHPS